MPINARSSRSTACTSSRCHTDRVHSGRSWRGASAPAHPIRARPAPWRSIGPSARTARPPPAGSGGSRQPSPRRCADDGEEKPLQLVVAERACRSGRMVQERLEGAGVGRGRHQLGAYRRRSAVSSGTRSQCLSWTANPHCHATPLQGGGSGGSQLGRCRGRGLAVRWQWQCWDRGRGGVSRRGRAPSAPRTRVSPSLPLQVAEG